MNPRIVLAPAVALLLAACTPAAAMSPPPGPGPSPLGVVGMGRRCTVVGGRADRSCTPGVRNPQVTQANIAATICRHGWTATVRPPVSYTDGLKRQGMVDYGEAGSPSGFEEDHEIPLELGGSPTDPGNLWPQPRTGPHPAAEKDRVENGLNRAVCEGRVKLTDAQATIVRDWTHA